MRCLRVLVTGAGGPVGQAIIRAARSSGLVCRLVAVDQNPLSVGLHWADACYVLPSAKDHTYPDRLATVCRLEQIDAVLIGSEEELRTLSGARWRMEEETGTRVIVSSPEVVEIATDKWETVRFLAAHGLEHPRSALPENHEQLEALIAEVGFPLIVKPRRGSGSQGLFKAKTRRDLELALGLAHRPVVQEYLAPDDREYTTAAFVDDSGQPQGSIIMRRQLAAGLTYRAWVEDDPLVSAVVRQVAGALRPLGPCNVQLRLTDRGPVPFEVNARFSSTTGMRAHFGYNEVEMALRCYVLGERLTAPRVWHGIALRFWDELYLPESAETGTSMVIGNLGERTSTREEVRP